MKKTKHVGYRASAAHERAKVDAFNISPTEDFVLTNFATSYGYFESFQILNGLLCHQSCLVGIIGGCKIHRMPLCGEQLWIPL